MELPIFRELLSTSGQAALSDAVHLSPTEQSFLACFETLRKKHPPALAKLAVEQAILRVKARMKFAAADRMYFTREALEQATGDLAAAHRARRFAPFDLVADLCCGIGGDALALAGAGCRVHAVDRDPLRLAMASANAVALELADRITTHEVDVLSVPLPQVRAAFADPDRRSAGRRILDPEAYVPPLSALRGRFASDFPLGIKAAPGVARAEIAGLDAEVEFVSVRGELKECVLWFGAFRTASYRASVLPTGVTLASDNPPSMPPVVEPGAYVFDPDPSVVRAGLAAVLAEQFGLAPIDHSVAMLTGPDPIPTPLATGYRVEFTGRFHLGRLRDYLRAHGVGRVTFIKRGSMVDTVEAEKKLKCAGSEHRAVLLTRIAGAQAMIVGERVTSSA